MNLANPLPNLTAGVHPSPIGMAKLLKMAFEGRDLIPLRQELIDRAEAQSANSAILLDLCAVEQYLGNSESGLKRQAQALSQDRLYRSSWPASSRALRVLAFAAPGDIGTNTPIEFLLQTSDVVLYTLYIVPGAPLPYPLPDHDIAIVTVGESDRDRPIMAEIERLIPTWPRPVLNPPDRVLRLSREETYRQLQAVPGLMMPATVRVDRAMLDGIGQRRLAIEPILPQGVFPLIARPVGSHAGRGLAKLENPEAIAGYLTERPEEEFFISRYIDYGSPDGLFRKYRVVVINGRPFPCHMALAGEWKVWYLNADMAESAGKRAEEARFMEGFDDGFARRHGAALAEVAERFGLDYFGLDCAELPDGRLLVFEADISMIVHDMDPVDIYPYKGPAMRTLFAGFVDMLARKSGRS